MNILMISNTYLPIVGGLERSIEAFTREYRRAGHRVIVVAPVLDGQPETEEDVVRVPAIQHFNGTDFALWLPIPGVLSSALGSFRPDVIHSHHPFLLGGVAVRLAAAYQAPLVFTHHTMYEKYTYTMPGGESPFFQQFVVELAVGYANLSDLVFAPSPSIAGLLVERGVTTRIAVVPTGIDLERFRGGDGGRIRKRMKIPAKAPLAGHVGRITREKDVLAAAEGVAEFLAARPRARFLLVGDGPLLPEVSALFARRRLARRLHCTGILENRDLVDAYRAMDVFVFASKTETQGIVLAEALGAGVPVVAVDAPAVRDVIRDGENGRLLPGDEPGGFAAALGWYFGLPAPAREALREAARRSAEPYSVSSCAAQALALYREAIQEGHRGGRTAQENLWDETGRSIAAMWKRAANITRAAVASVEKVIGEDRAPAGGKQPPREARAPNRRVGG